MQRFTWSPLLAILIFGAAAAFAVPPETTLDLRNTDTGEKLDLDDALPEGRDTAGVKQFLHTGINPYIEDRSCLKIGQEIFLSDCSGCHGHLGEGKIGPGLNDNYWTYPKNVTHQGLFETVFGGARAQMGPHLELTLDEILIVTAWVRHLYNGPVEDAPWLTDEQKKHYKPFEHGVDDVFSENPPGLCYTDKKLTENK